MPHDEQERRRPQQEWPTNIHIHHHADERIAEALCLLRKILERQESIMGALEDAQLALTRINAATNKMAAVQTAEADANAKQSVTLQTISDNIDKWVAEGKITGEMATSMKNAADALQVEADRSEALAEADRAQAEFSTAIAAKGQAQPVPAPPPELPPEVVVPPPEV